MKRVNPGECGSIPVIVSILFRPGLLPACMMFFNDRDGIICCHQVLGQFNILRIGKRRVACERSLTRPIYQPWRQPGFGVRERARLSAGRSEDSHAITFATSRLQAGQVVHDFQRSEIVLISICLTASSYPGPIRPKVSLFSSRLDIDSVLHSKYCFFRRLFRSVSPGKLIVTSPAVFFQEI